jgi:hypothetical protein
MSHLLRSCLHALLNVKLKDEKSVGFAVLRALGTEQATAVNKVDFIFNFFDELRRRVPAGTK